MRGGQADKACDALQKSAKLAATDPAHWMALAESAVATQNWTIAREALRNALGINPEIARAKELQTQLPPE
jgi:cytochrome c-type biogenesis protein CcmH/NrfG